MLMSKEIVLLVPAACCGQPDEPDNAFVTAIKNAMAAANCEFLDFGEELENDVVEMVFIKE
jgi:hypothetical protein